jgi:hypothetical protein
MVKVALRVRRSHTLQSIRQAVRQRSIRVCQSGDEVTAEMRDVPGDAVTTPRGQPRRAKAV